MAMEPLSNYNFTGHDNYNIEDVAVRKEGNTLKVTFSVRWWSPVTVTLFAKQTGQVMVDRQAAGTMNIHIRNLAGEGELKYNTDRPEMYSEAHKVNLVNGDGLFTPNSAKSRRLDTSSGQLRRVLIILLEFRMRSYVYEVIYNVHRFVRTTFNFIMKDKQRAVQRFNDGLVWN